MALPPDVMPTAYGRYSLSMEDAIIPRIVASPQNPIVSPNTKSVAVFAPF